MINPKSEIRNIGQLAISNLQLAKHWQLAISNSNSYMVNDKCMANGQWQMVNEATEGSN